MRFGLASALVYGGIIALCLVLGSWLLLFLVLLNPALAWAQWRILRTWPETEPLGTPAKVRDVFE